MAKEWAGFPDMPTTHLNSQVQQFDGFTTGQRVFGGTPKMPIGTAGSPNFEDFTNPKEAQTPKTRHLLGIIRQIRQASQTADFNGKLNLRLNRRFTQSGNGESFLAQAAFFLAPNRKEKGEHFG